jgi:tetratricopeptide (TPR) repeat protein
VGKRTSAAGTLNPQLVRSALKSLSHARALGEHPLAALALVAAECRAAGHGEDALGHGLALRAVLCRAIEQLRPGSGPVNPRDERWRPYVILTRRYISRRSRDDVAEELSIATATYYREYNRALDLLAGALYEQEQAAATPPPAGDGFPGPVFLAPPLPAHPLVGRAALVRDIVDRLCGSPPAPAALCGLPGAGKTALTAAIAHDPQVQAQFPDGVLWAGLGPQPDVLALLSEWAGALGLTLDQQAQNQNVAERARTLHAALGARRMLLVIDDAWQVETALAFKIGGPRCAHLLTTRLSDVALAFAGDGALAVGELSLDDSLALLARFAPAVAEHELASLVQASGGLPLALVLMGKYLRQETHTGQSRRVRRALDGLRSARQRLSLAQPQAPLEQNPSLPAGAPLSLAAVIEVSDRLLPGHAQGALRALAVFPPKPNTFSEEAALAVSAMPVETLDALIDAGLIETAGPGRYRMHQAIADYAQLQLDDERARARLVDYCAGYAAAHHMDFAALEPEMVNVLTALHIAHDRGQTAALVRLATAFDRFLTSRGLYALAETHLDRALQAARAAGDTPGLASVLQSLGQIAIKLGRYPQAYDYCREGLELARRAEDPQLVSTLLHNLGLIASHRGEHAQAEIYYRQSLDLARQNRDDHHVAALVVTLGVLAGLRSDYAQAEAYFLESLDLAQQLEHADEQILASRICLGTAISRRGDFARAEAHSLAGLALARQLGHQEALIGLLGNLGEIAYLQGRYAQAEAYLLEGIALARRSAEQGTQASLSELLASLGMVAHDLGDMPRADAYFQEALTIARRTGDQWYLSIVVNRWGEYCLAQARLAEAAAAFQEVADRSQRTGTRDSMAGALFGLARVSMLNGDPAAAQRQAQASLAIFEAAGHYRADEVRRWLAQLPLAG